MTNEKLAGVLAVLGDTYRVVIQPLATEGYRLALHKLTDEQLDGAARKALASCRFMPTPAELLALAGITESTDCADAWEAVVNAIHRHDGYASVDFGPLVNAVVRNLGTWPQLCDTLTTEMPWRRKKFEEIYALFAKRPPESLGGSPLVGLHGTTPVRIQIGPLPPPTLELPPTDTTPTRPMTRDLADAKAFK